jgi:signal transduction histidine kinase
MTNPQQEPVALFDADSGARDALLDEVARLELMRRLSVGVAHTLNNAFTAMLGETLCLVDERKHDPVVAEACIAIQQEIQRCARLTRSAAMRVQRRDGLLEETSLPLLLRGLEPLLRETVSRSVAIRCEAPPDGLYARGASDDIEPLLLLEAHRMAHDARSGGTLRIGVESGESHVDLVLALAARTDADPGEPRTGSAWQGLVEAALDAMLRRLGGCRIDVGPDERRLRLVRVPSA